MAHIFKHSYTTVNKKTGKRERRLTLNWYIRYKDEAGRWRRVPGFRDKQATKNKATALEFEVLQRLRGERPKRAAIGAVAPLVAQLDDYERHLVSKADTAEHVRRQRRRIEKVLNGVESIEDIARSNVEDWLASKRRRGANAATSNHFARAVKGFTRWLVTENRLDRDPLAGLRLLSVDADRRRVRRVLTDAEFGRLIETTRTRRTPVSNTSGRDRAMLYQLAAYTGLRRSELLSLTADSFSLGAATPTVTVEAAYSKRRRRDVLPLPSWLTAELRTWLRGRRGSIWGAGRWVRASEMLASDLVAAKIPVTDNRGRVYDFHALRSQYITGLARAGVLPATAQKLARHSTIDLTMKHYTFLEMADLADAVRELPEPPKAKRKR